MFEYNRRKSWTQSVVLIAAFENLIVKVHHKNMITGFMENGNITDLLQQLLVHNAYLQYYLLSYLTGAYYLP